MELGQPNYPDGGNSEEEAQLAALRYSVDSSGDGYVSANQDARFRAGAAHYILLWTDSGFRTFRCSTLVH